MTETFSTTTSGGFSYTRSSTRGLVSVSPVSSSAPTGSSGSRSGGGGGGSGAAIPTTSTVEVGGQTYSITRRGNEYSADGGKTWSSSSTGAASAAASAARAEDVRATAGVAAEKARLQKLEQVVLSGRASGEQLAEYYRQTDRGARPIGSVPYYTTGSGQRIYQTQEALYGEADMAAVRYAAATGRPAPDIQPISGGGDFVGAPVALPATGGGSRTAGKPSTQRTTLYTGIGPMETEFTPYTLEEQAKRVPATPEGISAFTNKLNLNIASEQFRRGFDLFETRRAEKTLAEGTAVVSAFETKWGSKGLLSPEEAYDYNLERTALLGLLSEKEASISASDRRLKQSAAETEAFLLDFEKAKGIIGYDVEGTGKIREAAVGMASARRVESRAAVDELLGPASLSEVARSAFKWGAGGAGVATLGGATEWIIKGATATTTGGVVGAGLVGAISGVGFEGGRLLASMGVRNMEKAGVSLEAGVMPQMRAEKGLLPWLIEEAPTLGERAKSVPSLETYYEKQLRGQDTSQWELYRPEMAIGIYRDWGVGAPAAFISASGATAAASALKEPVMRMTGAIRPGPAKVVDSQLYVSQPTKRMEMGAGDAFTYTKGAKVSGTFDVQPSRYVGGQPGSTRFKVEQVLETPWGGKQAYPFQYQTGDVQQVRLEDIFARQVSTTGKPGEGDVRFGVEVAGTRYQVGLAPKEPGMPSGLAEEKTFTRYTVTRFEQMGTSDPKMTLDKTLTLGATRSGLSSTELSTTSTKLTDNIQHLEFGGVTSKGGKLRGLSGDLYVTDVMPQKVTLIEPKGGPKTPFSNTFTPVEPSGGMSVIQPVSGPAEVVSTPGALPAGYTPSQTIASTRAMGAVDVASQQFMSEAVYLTTPPGYTPPVPALDVRFDEYGVLEGVYTPRGSPPPLSPITKFKPPASAEVVEYKTRFATATAVTEPRFAETPLVTDIAVTTYLTDSRTLDGYAVPRALEATRTAELSAIAIQDIDTRVSTAQLTVPQTRTDTITAPSRVPTWDFNFEMPGIGEVPPPPIIGGLLPPALGDDPFRGARIGERAGTKGAGRRLPVMANLFEVFEVEARTGREYRHPVGPKAEWGFAQALASGSDYFTPGFTKSKRTGWGISLPRAGKTKRKSRSRNGFSLWKKKKRYF